MLTDGSDKLKLIGSEGSLIDQSVNMVKSAATGLIGVGGNMLGYIGTGASYLTGI